MKKVISKKLSLSTITKFKKYFILLVFFFVTFSIHLFVLNTSKYSFGADGYYYSAQVHSYITKGRFFSPETSPILYFLVFLSKLIPNTVFANKVGISIITSCLFLAGYRLGRTFLRFYQSIFFGLLLVSTSFVSHFTFNFVKNLGGILFFILFISESLKFVWRINNHQTYIQKLTLCILFVLVFFSHKLMAGVAFFFVLPGIFNTQKFKTSQTLFVIFLGLVILFLFPYFFPNLIHWEDILNYTKELEFSKFQLPFLKYAKLYNKFYLELILLFLSPIVLFLNWKKIPSKKKQFWITVFLSYFILSFPFFHYAAYNFHLRMFLLIFIPCILFFIPLIQNIRNNLILLTLCILTCFYQFYTVYQMKDENNQDYELYDIILPLLNFPKDTLIIVHQGFDYFICYKNGGDAFHFLPEEKHKNRPIYRIVYGVSDLLYKTYLPEETTIQYLPGFYSVLKEVDWQNFVDSIPEVEKKRILNWKNPHEYRTKSMLRNERFKTEKKI
ncbi:hypothetical protein P3G55_14400 [Leptospira sp. 96542]|nr:hypothetical protein [Leptospira sp. 96542]